MTWSVVGGYIAAHFLLYVCVFRHRALFRTERGIFLFHVVPMAGLVALAFGAFLWNPGLDGFALVVGAGAAHGIYSLSFLECWLLSEGGYSLRILSELVRRGAATPMDLEQQFVDMSARKKIGRLESLLHLGLVQTDGDRFRLTRQGMALANAMTLVASLAGFERRAER